MINGTNVLRNDNPRWASINLPETPAVQAGPRLGATASIAGWLAGIPNLVETLLHRLGSRLYSTNDAEASWHGWQVTELHCGLSRRYRDARFDKPPEEE